MGKHYIFFILFWSSSYVLAQSVVSGIVSTEEGARIPNAVVLNISTDEKVKTNDFGEFKIPANYGQQIRVVKERFERFQMSVGQYSNVSIVLSRLPEEIEAVAINKLKITGDIAYDASQVRINQSEEALRQAIGLPRSPEKPREKAPEVKDVLLPLLAAQLNVDALYKLVSGKSKRMKRLYRYEDQQDNIKWMKSKIENEYFVSAGIPEDQINAFLLFCLADSKVLRYVNARNNTGLLSVIENNTKAFLDRLSHSGKIKTEN